MKPYYEEDGIQIFHGDCREILPQLEPVDVVITDPPYGIEGGHGGQTRDYRKADYEGSWFRDDANYVREVCAPVIVQCLHIAKTVVLTPGTRCLCSYPQPDDVGDFYSPASPRKGKFGFATCNPIFYYGYYKNAGKGALSTSYVLTEMAGDWGHPCPKPIKAWTWLVDRCSEAGNVILDPFMGSGTTLVAAKNLGRKAIGIEIEEKYCEIAVKRLAQGVLFRCREDR